MAKNQRFHIKTIGKFHKLLNQPKPEHPLISVIDIKPIEDMLQSILKVIVLGFYSISLKRDFKSPVKIKYGQQEYDFDEGVLSFMSPGQVSGFDPEKYGSANQCGWMLLIHLNFMWNTSLTKKIRQYDFFDYAVNEALFLSDKEETALSQIIGNIRQEYHNNMDKLSHNIIITQLESLLSYSERFYHRQFLTRRITSHQILERVKELLANYFDQEDNIKKGLPSVNYLAGQLNVSADYLSGLLKAHTGLTTQNHIHEKLIEKLKNSYLLQGCR